MDSKENYSKIKRFIKHFLELKQIYKSRVPEVIQMYNVTKPIRIMVTYFTV